MPPVSYPLRTIALERGTAVPQMPLPARNKNSQSDRSTLDASIFPISIFEFRVLKVATVNL